MSSRRLARGQGKISAGGIPSAFFEYAKTGGFWDTRAEVEAFCKREALGSPPAAYFRYPPGLRMWCIEGWALREGHVTKYGYMSYSKIRELGIWWGYGRDRSFPRMAHIFDPAEMESWRPLRGPAAESKNVSLRASG